MFSLPTVSVKRQYPKKRLEFIVTDEDIRKLEYYIALVVGLGS
ncbi:MAG: hypothetical protein QW208_03740 [Acidilobaceae archaeon]